MKKNNKIWFKRKRYGWGWVPVTWQGWLVITLEVLFLLLASQILLKDVPQNTYQSKVGIYLFLVLLSVLVLLFITNKKGPAPKWRWGWKKGDDKKIDY